MMCKKLECCFVECIVFCLFSCTISSAAVIPTPENHTKNEVQTILKTICPNNTNSSIPPFCKNDWFEDPLCIVILELSLQKCSNLLTPQSYKIPNKPCPISLPLTNETVKLNYSLDSLALLKGNDSCNKLCYANNTLSPKCSFIAGLVYESNDNKSIYKSLKEKETSSKPDKVAVGIIVENNGPPKVEHKDEQKKKSTDKVANAPSSSIPDLPVPPPGVKESLEKSDPSVDTKVEENVSDKVDNPLIGENDEINPYNTESNEPPRNRPPLENTDKGLEDDNEEEKDIIIDDTRTEVEQPPQQRNTGIAFKTEDSNFFSYFLAFTCLSVMGYIAFHNKNKILALALEGRRDRNGRRRPNTAGYRKLDTNLEETMSSHPSSAPSTNVIY